MQPCQHQEAAGAAGLGADFKVQKGAWRAFIPCQRSADCWLSVPVIWCWDSSSDSTVLLRRGPLLHTCDAQGGTARILEQEGGTPFAGHPFVPDTAWDAPPWFHCVHINSARKSVSLCSQGRACSPKRVHGQGYLAMRTEWTLCRGLTLHLPGLLLRPVDMKLLRSGYSQSEAGMGPVVLY